MSKLSFRARALDASKVLPIYRAHEIPDSADCSSINRTVPLMPTGMEKEEESEHHLQRAICSGTTIPTPEVYTLDDYLDDFGKLYPEDYKFPRQLIYMQPFSMEADIPDYDMDSDDEQWIGSQSVKLELTPNKFEEMMDRLEKGSGQTVVTLQEAKALIKEDDDLIIAVYDYWLNKRLKLQHPLIPQVKTEARYGVSNHNPYIAFRRRTEKMQTRKNRKNDESSYEKMLKLKRDLSRAVTLLEMVKRREKSKRELLHLSIEVFEKRYQVGDFSGQLVSDALSQRLARPAFTPLFQANSANWLKEDLATLARKDNKKHYKKRRHKSSSKSSLNAASTSANGPFSSTPNVGFSPDGDYSTDDEAVPQASPSDGDEEEEEGTFPFRRRLDCDYLPPVPVSDSASNSPSRLTGSEERPPSPALSKYQFYPTSVSVIKSGGKVGGNRRDYRNVGYARRRVGRGGRVVLDRTTSRVGDGEDFWRSVGFEVFDSHQQRRAERSASESPTNVPSNYLPEASSDPVLGNSSALQHLPHFRPKTPPRETLPVPGPSRLSSMVEEEELTEDSDSDNERVDPAVRLGMILGTITTRGDKPLTFDIANLLKDPTPHSLTRPTYLSWEAEEPPSHTGLLDKSSADLCNMHCIEMESEPKPEVEPWFGVMDMDQDLSSPADSFELIDLEADVPVITLDTEPERRSLPVSEDAVVPTEEVDGEGEVTTHLRTPSECMDTTDPSTPSSMSVTGEVVLVEGDLNGLDLERRRLLDKDNKENDRIAISSAKRDRVGSSQVEDEDEARVVENGDTSIMDTSEECIIVDEQKTSYFTSSKPRNPRLRNRKPRQQQ